jgi:hypothetical protein
MPYFVLIYSRDYLHLIIMILYDSIFTCSWQRTFLDKMQREKRWRESEWNFTRRNKKRKKD